MFKSVFESEDSIVTSMTIALLTFPFLESITVDHASDISSRFIARRAVANSGWASLVWEEIKIIVGCFPNMLPKLGFKWMEEKVQKMEQNNNMPPNITKIKFPALDVPTDLLTSDTEELDGSGI